MIQFKNPGTRMKRLTPFMSKFNPSLETAYAFYKTDPVGAMAQNSFSMMKRVRSVKEAILCKALTD
jgi:hypothetical protein